MQNLPFLKKRRASHAPEPQAERLVNGSSDDLLEDQSIDELMDAHNNKDPRAFRSAVEALVHNSFDWNKEHE